MLGRGGWFTDLRKTSLAMCVFGVLAQLIPMNKLAASLAASDFSPIWVVINWVSVLGYAALCFAFFWAMFRNRAMLILPDHLRLVALGAAAVLVIVGYGTFTDWAFGFREDWSFLTSHNWRSGAESIREVLSDPVVHREFGGAANMGSVVFYFFFLLALFRESGEEVRSDVPVSGFLRIVAKVALVVGGLIVAFLIFRVLATPYVYSQFSRMSAEVNRRPPPFMSLLWSTVRDLLVGLCYFASPFLVFMGTRGAPESVTKIGHPTPA